MVGHQVQVFKVGKFSKEEFSGRVPLRRRSLVICNALNKCAK